MWLRTLIPWARLKVAVTCSLAVSVTWQVEPTPLHPPPDQPAKVEPVAGFSVSVTCVPALKLALQVVGQLIPAGLLDTVPVPVPARLSVSRSWLMLKVAVTCWLALSVTVQLEAVPLQAPDHPANDEFGAGV